VIVRLKHHSLHTMTANANVNQWIFWSKSQTSLESVVPRFFASI
jgi:hypothetical protein